MNLTKEMIDEDDARWHARDVIAETGYLSKYIKDRKNLTNLDIRFFACMFRKAHKTLKAQEEEIQQLKAMHISASGNAVACGVLHGGLTIHQNADEITNIKQVDVFYG